MIVIWSDLSGKGGWIGCNEERRQAPPSAKESVYGLLLDVFCLDGGPTFAVFEPEIPPKHSESSAGVSVLTRHGGFNQKVGLH